jgi:hypothetical protein
LTILLRHYKINLNREYWEYGVCASPVGVSFSALEVAATTSRAFNYFRRSVIRTTRVRKRITVVIICILYHELPHFLAIFLVPFFAYRNSPGGIQ